MTERSPSLSVVVPVYNSAAALPQLVERLEPVLRASAERFELILVDDGSTDHSAHVARELAAAHPWIEAILLMRNYGQHNALLCGIRQARYAITVTMDDDLQHPPEELPKLLARLGEGADVVYGCPANGPHGFARALLSRSAKIALRYSMGAETAQKVSAFRAFRTELRNAFSHYKGRFVSIDVLLTWATVRFEAVEVEHAPRTIGTSNYNFVKLFVHATNMMTGFSTFPLRLASLVGFGFTLFGLGVLAYVLGRYLLEGSPVAGFPFLASVLAIFSGAQLFALGIMGEYVARVHVRTMGEPPYAIREITTAPAAGGSAGDGRA